MPRLPAGELEPIEERTASQAMTPHADTPEASEFLRMLSELD